MLGAAGLSAAMLPCCKGLVLSCGAMLRGLSATILPCCEGLVLPCGATMSAVPQGVGVR